jgi:hypothetical protein
MKRVDQDGVYEEGKSLRAPTHWQRRIKPGTGEVVVLLESASSNTITTIQHESPIVIDALHKASRFVRLTYGEKAPDDAMLIREIRQTFPVLDGQPFITWGGRSGAFIMSDEGLKGLIDRVSKGGKLPAGSLYDLEIQRTTKGEVSAETSRTYRKPSKQSRQKKQSKPGRPRKNSA